MRRFTLSMLCTLIALARPVWLFADESGQAQLPKGVVATEPTSGRSVKVEGGWMVPYEETIPGTFLSVKMVPVPGGVYTFGAAPDDENRGDYELDAVQVKLEPFWIAVHEVTWSLYWSYMELNDDFTKLETIKARLASDDPDKAAAARQVLQKSQAIAQAVSAEVTMVDGVTAPTPLYDPSTTYECGEDPQQPASTMTPYAAKQFTKWLSRVSGQQYRLPTEAEWEYAARAGSQTAYPWGNDEQGVEEHAWYEGNADYVTHKVGQLKPNAWGIHDMIGNVAEWVIDEYSDELERPADKTLTWDQAVHWTTSNEARICRGGFYDSAVEDCRSTSRFYSEDADWKASDPNSPLSPWWYTDYPSTGVGIRVVRSYKRLSPELEKRFWEFESEEITEDVESRVAGGRGKLGPANESLPAIRDDLKISDAEKLLGSGE